LFQFDENTYLLCRFRPINNNYKNNNWKISEEMNFTDTIFIIKVPTSIEITEIQNSLRPVLTPAIQEIEIPVVDLEPERGVLALPVPILPGVDFSFEQSTADLAIERVRADNGSSPGVTQPDINFGNNSNDPNNPNGLNLFGVGNNRSSNKFNIR
jgi:hypothetical protein